jgi:hypothetical protein
MTLKQLAKHLDKRAIEFARIGEIQKTFAAMEIAAFIRRKSASEQNLDMMHTDK